MPVLTTFHLDADSFQKIRAGQRHVELCLRRDTHLNDEIRFACDSLRGAYQAQVRSVIAHHQTDTMTVFFTNLLEIDYDICD